jgi:hypothetical protein
MRKRTNFLRQCMWVFYKLGSAAFQAPEHDGYPE